MRLGRLITIVACAAVLALAVSAGAATPPTGFGDVSYGGDTWTNYDLTATNKQSVDWPVDLIFWGNASISKIQSKLGWLWTGSTIYALVDDGAAVRAALVGPRGEPVDLADIESVPGPGAPVRAREA